MNDDEKISEETNLKDLLFEQTEEFIKEFSANKDYLYLFCPKGIGDYLIAAGNGRMQMGICEKSKQQKAGFLCLYIHAPGAIIPFCPWTNLVSARTVDINESYPPQISSLTVFMPRSSICFS